MSFEQGSQSTYTAEKPRRWDVPDRVELSKLANLARSAERQGGHNGMLPARRVAVGPRAAEINAVGAGGTSGAAADPEGQPVVFSGLAQDWLVRQRGRFELMRRIGAIRMKLRECASIASFRGPGSKPSEEVSVTEFFGERSPSVGHYVLSETGWHQVHRALRGSYQIPAEVAHVGQQPLFSAERRGAGVGFQRQGESWMAQAFGRKVWILIPAYHPRPKVGSGSWWQILPIDQGRGPRCGWCRKRAVREFQSLITESSSKPVLPPDARICLTHPGDVIYVPRCWWFASVSVDDFCLGIGWSGGIEAPWDESTRAVLSGDIERLRTLPVGNTAASLLSALRLAAEASDIPALQLLLDLPIAKEAVKGTQAGDVVAAAARTGQVEILELLDKAGADILASADSSGGSQALHWAARCGHIRVAVWLLSHKADVEAVDHYGRPLHYASYFGHVEIISLLLGAKASTSGLRKSSSDRDNADGPLATKHGVARLKEAIGRCGDQPGDIDAFEVVRPQALQPSLRPRALGESSSLQLVQRRTPLHLAAAQGHLAVVVALLKANASSDTKDAWGLDPFVYAEAAGHREVAVQIAQSGFGDNSSSEDDDIEDWIRRPGRTPQEPEPESAPEADRL